MLSMTPRRGGFAPRSGFGWLRARGRWTAVRDALPCIFGARSRTPPRPRTRSAERVQAFAGCFSGAGRLWRACRDQRQRPGPPRFSRGEPASPSLEAPELTRAAARLCQASATGAHEHDTHSSSASAAITERYIWAEDESAASRATQAGFSARSRRAALPEHEVRRRVPHYRQSLSDEEFDSKNSEDARRMIRWSTGRRRCGSDLDRPRGQSSCGRTEEATPHSHYQL